MKTVYHPTNTVCGGITMIYNINIDLVNDNVYKKFGLNRSIRFQDIEQKLNSDVNHGP